MHRVVGGRSADIRSWPQIHLARLVTMLSLFSMALGGVSGEDDALPRLCREGSCTPLRSASSRNARAKNMAFAASSAAQNRPSYGRCCHSCGRVASCSASGGDEHHIVKTFLPHMASPPSGRARRFLEIGGFDGSRETNTLFVEHCLGWEGLLIEAQPKEFESLRANRPGVLTLHAAACADNATHVNFVSSDTDGHIARDNKVDAGKDTTRVPCVNLGTALPTLGFERIDYFSLDVQGAELLVAKSVDWSAVEAAVVVVEELRVLAKKNKAVESVLLRAGMLRVMTLCWHFGRTCDGYFVNPRMVDVAGLSRAVGSTNLTADHLDGIGMGCSTEKLVNADQRKRVQQRTLTDREWLIVTGHALTKQRQFLNTSVDCTVHDEQKKYPYRGTCALCGNVGRARGSGACE